MTYNRLSYGSAHGQQGPDLNSIDTFAKVGIGTLVHFFSDTFGEGGFIYLPGAAAVVAGDLVTYDLLPGGVTVTRVTAAGQPNTGAQIAVALQTVGAGSFGWFQIAGLAVVNAIAATAVGRAFLSATAGSVSSTAAAGIQILNARISSAVGTPSAGKSYMTIQRPFIQGQIT